MGIAVVEIQCNGDRAKRSKKIERLNNEQAEHQGNQNGSTKALSNSYHFPRPSRASACPVSKKKRAILQKLQRTATQPKFVVIKNIRHKGYRGSNFHAEEMPLKLFDTRLWNLGRPRFRNYNVILLHGCSYARTMRKKDCRVCYPCQMKTRAERDEYHVSSVLGTAQISWHNMLHQWKYRAHVAAGGLYCGGTNKQRICKVNMSLDR